MKNILSGIQPTGNLHIGNYIGAIKNWVKMQHEYKAFLFIADMHAITVPQDPKELKEAILKTAATYIACGIDPTKACIFVQSDVRAHPELAWIFSCLTPIGWLNRMTQFKDKAGKNKEKASMGLYSYPVLMAADILLYKPDYVPVGEDQKQHLELARDIASAFNRRIGQEYFNLPEPYIIKETARVMSLRDGTKKMSKSDPSDYSRINLTDKADEIANKIKKAKSDSEAGISYNLEKRPECSNLLSIYSVFTEMKVSEIEEQFVNKSFSELKSALAELLVTKLVPISNEIQRLCSDKAYLEDILAKSTARAIEIADKTVKETKAFMGLGSK